MTEQVLVELAPEVKLMESPDAANDAARAIRFFRDIELVVEGIGKLYDVDDRVKLEQLPLYPFSRTTLFGGLSSSTSRKRALRAL